MNAVVDDRFNRKLSEDVKIKLGKFEIQATPDELIPNAERNFSKEYVPSCS